MGFWDDHREPNDPPTEEEQRAGAWEYWHQRALAAERERHTAVQIQRNASAALDSYREALDLIADIAEGSTTANSLPNIAKIARDALSRPKLEEETE